MTPKYAWSYSALNQYNTCPYQYYRLKIKKDVKDSMNEAALWGNEVHKHLEHRLRHKTPLPERFKQYEYLARPFDAAKGVVLAEQKLTLNRNLDPTTWFAPDAWCRGIVDVTVLNEDSGKAFAGDWKGLALHTPLPTPSGWTTMGDIEVGDSLYASDGTECTVVGKSDVHMRKCYKIVFDDTTEVTCDDEHLWPTALGVLSTEEMYQLRATKGKHVHNKLRVNVARPIAGSSDVNLPVPPYVLGLWIGDGKHTSGEVCKPDQHVWDRVVSYGYALGVDTGRSNTTTTRTILGLRTQLREAGLLSNKHIPAVYLRADYDSRKALLQGLMDSDGNANSVRRQAIFTTCDKGLSDSVMELLLSLGQRPLQSRTTQRGFGKTVTAWPISFKPLNGLNPFSLPRKADRISASWGEGKSYYRRVKHMEEVPTEPTQCIAVDSVDHTYLCTRKFLPTHNTGKRKPDSDQLMLFAALIFAHYEFIDRTDTAFIWVKDKKTDKESFTRDQEKDIWDHFYGKLARLEQSLVKDTWKKNPSGLCKGWCPVRDCPYWEPKKT